MYYLIMKIALKSDLERNIFCSSKSYTHLREKEVNSINFKVYQRLFVVLISLTTILIFPESPKELENICEAHNSRNLCIVW